MKVGSIYLLSYLMVLFSCLLKFNKIQDFPQTDNKEIKVKKLTIWEFSQDTLKLYTTINTECKECKPFYEKGVIWKTLLKK